MEITTLDAPLTYMLLELANRMTIPDDNVTYYFICHFNIDTAGLLYYFPTITRVETGI